MSRSSQKQIIRKHPFLGNKIEEKSSDVVLDRIEAYFDLIGELNVPPTIVGMSTYLGFSCVDHYFDYVRSIPSKKKELFHAYRLGITLIEHEYEGLLHTRGMAQNAGFALKNLGWRDSLTLESKEDAMPNIRVSVIQQEKPSDVGSKDHDNREVRTIPGTVQV